MPLAGLVMVLFVTAVVVAVTARIPRRVPFGLFGLGGTALLAVCSLALAAPIEGPVVLTPLACTGYVIAVDSAVHSIRGRSIIRSQPDAFVWLAVLSVFFWLPFEWYNLRLAVWYRSGLPTGVSRYLLLGWIYACIWPALFETADLLRTTVFRRSATGAAIRTPLRSVAGLALLVGAACLVLPLVLPRLGWGEHLYLLPCFGFLLAFEAWNVLRGRNSLVLAWLSGNRGLVASLATAGAYCGLGAECLNYGAGARWHGIATLGSGFRVFELPVIAYVAFPVLGLQSYAAYTLVTDVVNLPSLDLESGWRAFAEDK